MGLCGECSLHLDDAHDEQAVLDVLPKEGSLCLLLLEDEPGRAVTAINILIFLFGCVKSCLCNVIIIVSRNHLSIPSRLSPSIVGNL